MFALKSNSCGFCKENALDAFTSRAFVVLPFGLFIEVIDEGVEGLKVIPRAAIEFMVYWDT